MPLLFTEDPMKNSPPVRVRDRFDGVDADERERGRKSLATVAAKEGIQIATAHSYRHDTNPNSPMIFSRKLSLAGRHVRSLMVRVVVPEADVDYRSRNWMIGRKTMVRFQNSFC